MSHETMPKWIDTAMAAKAIEDRTDRPSLNTLKPRHKHDWEPTWEHTLDPPSRRYVGLVCTNGCGKEYKPPTPKQTEARRKNFCKMQVLGNLVRAKANVQWGQHVDPDITIYLTGVITGLIERARKEL